MGSSSIYAGVHALERQCTCNIFCFFQGVSPLFKFFQPFFQVVLTLLPMTGSTCPGPCQKDTARHLQHGSFAHIAYAVGRTIDRVHVLVKAVMIHASCCIYVCVCYARRDAQGCYVEHMHTFELYMQHRCYQVVAQVAPLIA